jgi:cell shape-determining protein MreC
MALSSSEIIAIVIASVFLIVIIVVLYMFYNATESEKVSDDMMSQMYLEFHNMKKSEKKTNEAYESFLKH